MYGEADLRADHYPRSSAFPHLRPRDPRFSNRFFFVSMVAPFVKTSIRRVVIIAENMC